MTDNIKHKINNEIVSMRCVVRQAKVHIIHKLTRSIKQLRTKKGTETQKLKNTQKADRYVQEISTINKLNPDFITKYALTVKESLKEILANVNTTSEERALARLASYKIVTVSIDKIKDKYAGVIEQFIKPTKKNKITSKIKESKSKKVQVSNQCIQNIESNELKEKTDEKIKDNKNLICSTETNITSINLVKSKEIDESNVLEDTQVKQKKRKKKHVQSNEINEVEQKIESNIIKPRKKIKTLDSIKDVSNVIKFNDNVNINKKSESSTNKIGSNSIAVKSKINLSELKNVETLDSFLKTEKKLCSSSKMENSLKCDQSVDTFFLSGNDSDFLHVAVENKSDSNIEQVEKKRHNNQLGLNRKQRRSRMFNRVNVFSNNKNVKKSDLDNNFYMNAHTFDKKEFKNKSTGNEKEQLHPSWQAKKMLKPQIIEFQGKKITFDD